MNTSDQAAKPLYLTPDEQRFILEQIIKHKDRDGLHEWIELNFGVNIPRVSICEDHDAPFDFVCGFLFDEFQTAIVLANRSGGKTYIFAILIAIVTFLYADIEVANIAAIEAQAKRCYNYFSNYIDKEPFASNVDAKTMNKTKLANGSAAEILVATMTGVNSPHPQIAFFDEIDLWLWPILQQAFSMAQSKNGFESKMVLTSTRKFPNGPMQKMLDEAKSKGAKVYKWCIWEVMEPLPLHDSALMKRIYDAFGGTLPKNIAKANGYYTWKDVINKYKTLDQDTWASDWLCIKPGLEGIIYGSSYSDERNLIPPFDPRSRANGRVYLFEDFGYGESHPDVVLFCWLSPDNSELIGFRELYITKEGTDAIWDAIVEKLAEYDLAVDDVIWVPDYHGHTEIADRMNRGAVMLEKVEDSTAYLVINGISMVKKLFEAGLLKITTDCVNLRAELLSYRRKKNLDGTFSIEPKKVDDHGPDALRYGVIQLFQLMMQYLVGNMEEKDEAPFDSSEEAQSSITSGLYGKTF